MRIIELQYLPTPAYIAQFLLYPDLHIDGYEYYVKQTFRNRCTILTANGVDQLSVPVIGSGKKILSKDIQIDHDQKWLNRHWRAIKSAYGRAPYFEFYSEEYHGVFQKKHRFLFDLSMEMLTQCLTNLQFEIDPQITSTYLDLKDSPEKDLRDSLTPKTNLGVTESCNQRPYQQVFGSNFVNNMSVLDLIFCEGPSSGEILKAGIAKGTE